MEKHSQANCSRFPDLSDSVLSEADNIKFRDFQSYRDACYCFWWWQTSLVQHVIGTGDALLIKQRRIEPVFSVIINKKLIAKWRICSKRESLENPFLHGVHPKFSSKKDGSFRFCVDLREVNAIKRKDSFPMPLVSDTLDALNWLEIGLLANWKAPRVSWKNSFRYTQRSLRCLLYTSDAADE